MLDKTYQPSTVEPTIYTAWESTGVFACDQTSQKPTYTIMMPPPNVTGSLHLGHALTYTLQDILVRFKRLSGFDVLWQPGTDHAGIATQMVVERQLASEGKKRTDLGREAFLKRVWQWKEESGGAIVNQQRRLGISPDWGRQRFTLDEGLSKAVTKVFVELYRQGLIYRDKRLVNWDLKLQTAISDLEVVNHEVKSQFWYIQYPLEEDPTQYITIATTRPETMFGDVAVAVHPEDERFQHLIGKKVILPLSGRSIPIIADTYSDPEKGTGAVKITPGHDFNDFEVGKRHRLDPINILDASGHLNENVPKAYQGLDFMAARAQVVIDLQEQGVLAKTEELTNFVPHGVSSGAIIQPWLTDQWFVDAKTLAEPAIQAVEEGRTRFMPEHWANTYFEWLNNIQPWCISRQIWWGHQIPAWYGPDGEVFIAENTSEAESLAQKHYGHVVELKRDSDVLDTWFSSALWPFSTLGWPESTPELGLYYPGDVLMTGFDIIFFWVARMMMMGLHFMKDIPFHTVYIHALVRDEKGQKMSKSKGNIIDPLKVIDKFGTDALRFTLATLASPGRDIKLGESHIEGSRNFMTKIWNAARFLEMNNCTVDSNFNPTTCQQTINRWIISEVAQLSCQLYQQIQAYRFDEAAHNLYKFLWGSYCDFYLEFLKPILMGDDENARKESQQTAAWALAQVLHIAHPFIPFITEKLWQDLFSESTFLMAQSWPAYAKETIEKGYIDTSAQQEVTWLIELITQIRSLRAEFNVPPKALLHLKAYEANNQTQDRLHKYAALLNRLGRLENIAFEEKKSENTAEGVQFIINEATFVLILGEAIDVKGEKNRLQRELQHLEADINSFNRKLQNADFLAKAKSEVVEEVRSRLDEATSTKNKISQALTRLN